MPYFIALLSTLFVFGTGVLMILSQVSEYALSQRKLSEWVYHTPIAHRGLFDNALVPENSLAAFSAAVQKGYAIELDVHLCADGEVVVFHDIDMERATGQKGAISQVSLKDMSALKLWTTQETIPSLKSTLELVQGRVPLFIEIKNNGEAGALEQKVHQLLKQYQGPVMIVSFNPKTLEWFRLNAPEYYRAQNLPLREWRSLSFYKACRQALKTCKLSKPHVIIYNALRLPPRVVKVLSWFKPFIAYNVTSIEAASSLKGAVTNIIFESFKPQI